MVKITIGENEAGQRLDRFLKKYYNMAPLSAIYRMIRKDVKVNGKRAAQETILSSGDELCVYITDEQDSEFRKAREIKRARKSFKIAYEDENLLVAEKPAGLLTHGDRHEKKNHLTNQVISYLIEKGEYSPRVEKTFTPSPANRLDRNTSGLVLFGKTAAALRTANRMIREEGYVSKFYLTVVAGHMASALDLRDMMEKDAATNTVRVFDEAGGETGGAGEPTEPSGKLMQTRAVPLAYGKLGREEFTLVEVELITGRTHQIRAHLSKAGYPIIGDAKYGKRRVNDLVGRNFGLTTQLLHAYRLEFSKGEDELSYMEGKVIKSELTPEEARIVGEIFGEKGNYPNEH